MLNIQTGNDSYVVFHGKSESAGTTGKGRWNRFNSYLVPVAMATALLAPGGQGFVIERVSPETRTPLRRHAFGMHWDEYATGEEPWSYVPELVTAAHVSALDALFALSAPLELPSYLVDE